MAFLDDQRKRLAAQQPGAQTMGLGQLGQLDTPAFGGPAATTNSNLPGLGGMPQATTNAGMMNNGMGLGQLGQQPPGAPGMEYGGEPLIDSNPGVFNYSGGIQDAGGLNLGNIAAPPPGNGPAQALAQRFNLEGSQVHGRAADTRDPNDLMWLASQQPGFDISSNEAAQRTYANIIGPMLQQQGIQSNLAGKNFDRVDLGGGRTLDFIGNASNPDASQRRMWVGDSANPGAPAATAGGGQQVDMSGGGGNPVLYAGGGAAGGGGGAPASGPGSPGYQFSPIAQAAAYAPQNVQGPDPLALDALNQPDKLAADQVGPGQQVTAQTAAGGPAVNATQAMAAPGVQAGTAQAGAAVNAERIMAQGVGGPERIAAQQVQGPGQLSLSQLGDPARSSSLTAEEFAQDPGVNIRQQRAVGAAQSSAAAKGLLHSGGFVKGLADYVGDSTSAEYAAADARKQGLAQQNFQNQFNTTGANNAASATGYGLTNQYQQQAALANQGANLGAAQFNSQQGQQAGMFNAGQGQQAQAQNASNNLQAQSQNSAQGQQVGLANIGNQLQAGMFNAGNQQQANQFNAAAQNQTGMFNSGQQQQSGQFNAANAQQAGQFNSAQGQQAALANQGANLQAGQFNAGMDFNTQQANQANRLAAYNAYQPLNQQNQQFNAAQQASAAQNNFANRFATDTFNATGGLNAFNANLGAELGRGGLENQRVSNANQYSLGQGQLALGNRQADQAYQLGLGNLGVSQGHLGIAGQSQGLAAQAQQFGQEGATFDRNYGVYRDNRDTAFNQDYALTQLGYGAASGYGNAAGGLYANQGQANAGAAIGQGNAAAGAVGGVANAAQQYAAWRAAQGMGAQ